MVNIAQQETPDLVILVVKTGTIREAGIFWTRWIFLLIIRLLCFRFLVADGAVYLSRIALIVGELTAPFLA